MAISTNNFIDLGLRINENDTTAKNILLVGNTKGFFGNKIEGDTIANYSSSEVVSNNYSWLEYEYNECKSNIYVIADDDTIKYYNYLIQEIANWCPGTHKKWKSISIDWYAKKYKISEDKKSIGYVNIIKELSKKKYMKFDKIIMNPPYDNGLGGKITFEVISLLKDDKDCICLMPLSNYKNKSAALWRNVKTFELADPKLFVDADITKNLCICTLENKNVDKYSWEDMQFESFDKRYIEFYKRNKELPSRYVFRRCDNATAEEFDFKTDWIDNNRVCNWRNGYTLDNNNKFFALNVSHIIPDTLPHGLCCIRFDCDSSHDNFSKFSASSKDNLWHKVLFGLGFDTVSDTCSIAIPQIDWETISDNPLWKKGDYDGAVLDVMGLMWDENKSNIVRKINT
jgi:hypothetical protein